MTTQSPTIEEIKQEVTKAKEKIYTALYEFHKNTGQDIKEIILHKGDLGFGMSTILDIELPVELKL